MKHAMSYTTCLEANAMASLTACPGIMVIVIPGTHDSMYTFRSTWAFMKSPNLASSTSRMKSE
jgi:hypothetical protein